MHELRNFFYDTQLVRVVPGPDGEPWFVGADVARVLGYTNPTKAVRDHCKGVNESFVPSAGGQQLTCIIPERDIYRMVMRSKLPAAEAFESWVVGEVLPSIRRTGAYAMSEPSGPVQVLLTASRTEILRMALRMSEEKDALKAETVHEPEAPLMKKTDQLRVPEGSVWIYPLHGYWCLKAHDGEILAEIHGSSMTNLWTYKDRQYHELENAKDAAIRSLRAQA